jgi:hypothetical protein
MMKRVLLVLAMTVGGAVAPVVVVAQTPVTDAPGEFRFELEEAQNPTRGRAVEGYVYNNLPWRITNVRVRVETLDATGAVTGESSGWVVGGVKGGGRAYFYVPVSSPAASYRASVQSYHKVGLESQLQAP